MTGMLMQTCLPDDEEEGVNAAEVVDEAADAGVGPAM